MFLRNHQNTSHSLPQNCCNQALSFPSLPCCDYVMPERPPDKKTAEPTSHPERLFTLRVEKSTASGRLEYLNHINPHQRHLRAWPVGKYQCLLKLYTKLLIRRREMWLPGRPKPRGAAGVEGHARTWASQLQALPPSRATARARHRCQWCQRSGSPVHPHGEMDLVRHC